MEKLKTLTVGGVTYEVCAPLTEEEKQEVAGRVLEGISYEEILAPHKQAIAQQAAADVQSELEFVTRTLTEADFAIGRIASSGAYDPGTKNMAVTPDLLECSVDKPYSVTANGDSTVTIGYYGKDGAYLGRASGLKEADNVCDFYTGEGKDIAYVRFVINYHGNTTAFIQEDIADVVAEFTFACRQSDPYVRNSELAGYISQETGERMQQEVDYCTGKNLICTVEQKTQGGIAITHAGGGKYDVTQSAATSDVSMAIYDKSNALPPNIERGKTYRFGGNFPAGVSMYIIVYSGADKLSDNSVSRKNTKDIFIPENATGMAVYLFFSSKYDYAGKTLQTEMISAESAKYACELVRKHHPGTDPAPMLTIIDDDGYLDFRKYLLPIIIGQEAQDGQPEVKARHIPIASAVPVALIEPEGQTRPGKSMSWSEIENCALAGAEILSHTYNNIGRADVEQKNMTLEQIAYDYRLAQSHLQHHGIPAEGLVFVKDSSNVERCVEACKQVYQYGFKADSGTDEILVNYAGTTDPYGILRNGATFYTADALKFMIDRIAGKTGWLVWMLHTSDNQAKIHDVVKNAEGQAVGIAKGESEIKWPEFAPQLADAIDYALEKGVQIVSTKCGFAAYCR